MQEPLGLRPLLTALRDTKIRVGPHEVLRLRQVFLAQPRPLDDRPDDEAPPDEAKREARRREHLRAILAAVLLKRAEDRTAFDDCFDAWYRLAQSEQLARAPARGEREPQGTPPPRPAARRIRQARQFLQKAGWGLIALAAFGLAIVISASTPDWVEPVIAPGSDKPTTQRRPVEQHPRERDTQRTFLPEIHVDPAAAHWTGWPALLLGLLGLGVTWTLWLRLHGRTWLPETTLPPPQPGGPPQAFLRAPDPDTAILLDKPQEERLVWGIERFVTDEPTRRLDLPATVRATARQGGLPALHFQHAARHREVWLWAALLKAGRYGEAEPALRRIIAEAVAAGDYGSASTAAGDLLNLLMFTGRLQEALQSAEEKAAYSAKAGRGPWRRLLDEGQRLQVLNAMGRYLEVLERVEALRPELATLPAPDESDGAINPRNVREVLLDTGRSAAMRADRWEQALALNAEGLKVTEGRGAGVLELARARFNDYFPLLRLGRHQDCYDLLQECRAVFEAEHDIPRLGKVYSALADLQDKTGDRGAAVGFEQVALRFKYQAGQPEACAISHHKLANYLKRSGSDAAGVLAHRLAAAAAYIQIGFGLLEGTIRNLANVHLPAEPPAFATVADRVEQVEGVRFRALFAALPPTYPDGDAAIAAVWQQVLAEKERRAQEAAVRQAALAALPPELAAALESGEEGAIGKAVDALSPEQQAAVTTTLREAGLLPDEPAEPPSEEDLLRQWGPLLEAIAAVANGDDSERAAIEEVLAEIEEKGWMLREPVARIWAGEQDADALTADLDAQDAALVRVILARL
jgi:uncharacterized protein with von Willebrand factor type A (vWA) domain